MTSYTYSLAEVTAYRFKVDESLTTDDVERGIIWTFPHWENCVRMHNNEDRLTVEEPFVGYNVKPFGKSPGDYGSYLELELEAIGTYVLEDSHEDIQRWMAEKISHLDYRSSVPVRAILLVKECYEHSLPPPQDMEPFDSWLEFVGPVDLNKLAQSMLARSGS